MTTTLAKKSLSDQIDHILLQQNAVLVDLDISFWRPTKKDVDITQEVADAHNTTKDAGNYYKRLIPKEVVAKVRSILAAFYKYHMENTMPWGITDFRVLPASRVLDYKDEFRRTQGLLDAAVDELAEHWDEMVEDQRRKRNGMFKLSDYPTKEGLKNKFKIRHDIQTMPDGSHFVANVGEAQKAAIRQEIDASVDKIIREALQEPVERLVKLVKLMVDRLSAYSEAEQSGEKMKFYASWIENVRDLADIMPALNVTDDPKMAELTKIVTDGLLTYSPETLKDSQSARVQTVKAANAFFEAVSDFMA